MSFMNGDDHTVVLVARRMENERACILSEDSPCVQREAAMQQADYSLQCVRPKHKLWVANRLFQLDRVVQGGAKVM